MSAIFITAVHEIVDCLRCIIWECHTGMSAVNYPENVIALSEYINVSRYTTDGGAFGSISSKFRINSYTNVTVIDNPGKLYNEHLRPW